MIQWQGMMGIAIESNYGTAVTTPTRYIDVNEASFNPEVDIRVKESATSTRVQTDMVKTGIDYSFNWEQWGTPNTLAELLYCALGSEGYSYNLLATGEHQHTFYESTASSLPSFTIFFDHGISNQYRGYGCKIGSLTIESAAREVMLVSVEGICQGETTGSFSPTVPDDIISIDPFIFKNLVFSNSYCGAGLSQNTAIERYSITINNNLIGDKNTANGSYEISALPEGVLEVTGEFDIEFSGADEYNGYKNLQETNIKAVWTGEPMGTNDFSLELHMPNCRIETLERPPIAGSSDRGVITVSFRGLYDASSDYLIKAVLQNEIDNLSA